MATILLNNTTLTQNIENERMYDMATITTNNYLTLINKNERMNNMTNNVMTLNNKKSGSLIDRISDWLQERRNTIREMAAEEMMELCQAQELGIGIGAYLKQLLKRKSENRNALIQEMAMDYYRAIEDGVAIPTQMQLLDNIQAIAA
ncbi:MAG: hypothetical protein FWG98_14700 [Candidatus Cloacimonetes bacterium]|nr:hypothetical protein [Candidatus Cloacimonadota bacterium]